VASALGIEINVIPNASAQNRVILTATFFMFFNFYGLKDPEPTLGSAKNPDSGADLNLSLVNLPPLFTKTSVV
jgi:hypothetical protein